MRGELRRAVALLRMERSLSAVIAEIVALCALAPVLWLIACLFVLLEPLP